jgi:hypothetical protein
MIKQIKADEMGRTIACMGEMRNTYKILVGKTEGKRPLGRPRHRCEDNIKIDLAEIMCEGVDWIHLTHDRDRPWNQSRVYTSEDFFLYTSLVFSDKWTSTFR